MVRKFRNAVARPDQKAAPAASPHDARVTEAQQFHRAGRLEEAERLYRGILAANPHHAEALHLLGLIAVQRGQYIAATDFIQKAIAEREREPRFHNTLGLALQALQRFDEAVRHFKRAMALKPDFADAAKNLGTALLLTRQTEEATNATAAALSLVQSAELKDLFGQCLSTPQDAAKIKPARRTALRALQESWARPENIARNICGLVASDGTLGKAVVRANASWPRGLSLRELEATAAAADPLLQALLVSTRVRTVELERYLTSLRLALLESAQSPSGAQPRFVPLASALAQQCFINEYAFAVSETEDDEVRRLHDDIAAALLSGESISPFRLALLASYSPLSAMRDAEKLLDGTWPEPIARLLVQQVRDPAIERHLRAEIPRLTKIEDNVSVLVRQQYEDNPYPRWIGTPLNRATQASSEKGQEILVAGCGTGRQLVDAAQYSRAVRVIGVDLSLTSLAYALRKIRELGLDNVEVAQGDILELGAIGRTFDHITVSGVLHHLADPWLGWRVLLSLLRPGGTMSVALYSELARRPLAKVRSFIAERGYTSSPADIRRFRQDVLERADLAMLAESPDFYTVSSCRDLVFHAQEHLTTLPAIKAFLVENRLEFVRFVLGAERLQAFRKRFPAEDALTDLDRWHAFECENPATFVRMYQFVIRKPEDRG